MRKFLYKLKRWWTFQMSDAPKVGEVLTFYPFDPDDTLRQDVIIVRCIGEYIYYKFVGEHHIMYMNAYDFLSLYRSKRYFQDGQS